MLSLLTSVRRLLSPVVDSLKPDAVIRTVNLLAWMLFAAFVFPSGVSGKEGCSRETVCVKLVRKDAVHPLLAKTGGSIVSQGPPQMLSQAACQTAEAGTGGIAARDAKNMDFGGVEGGGCLLDAGR